MTRPYSVEWRAGTVTRPYGVEWQAGTVTRPYGVEWRAGTVTRPYEGNQGASSPKIILLALSTTDVSNEAR